MTVSELITALRTVNPNAQVKISADCEGDEWCAVETIEVARAEDASFVAGIDQGDVLLGSDY